MGIWDTHLYFCYLAWFMDKLIDFNGGEMNVYGNIGSIPPALLIKYSALYDK